MTTRFNARDTTAGDTFETNYTDPATYDSREWIRQLTVDSATEVESVWTLPNNATEIITYHAEVPQLAWGTGNYITRLRVGANGENNVELREVYVRRVSADGNTVRASISVTGLTGQTLSANTNRDNTISDSGGI